MAGVQIHMRLLWWEPMTNYRIIKVVLPVLLLAGCATSEISAFKEASCLDVLAQFDQHADDLGIVDAETSPVAGYRFLRANRNSVMLKKRLDGDDDGVADRVDLWRDWIAQMRGLDRETRTSIAARMPDSLDQEAARAEECANQLADGLMPSSFADLSRAVFVPDDYRDFQRIAGFYPLSAIPAHFGYETWKKDNFPSFHWSADQLWRAGDWIDYRVMDKDATDVASIAGRDKGEIPKDAFGQSRPDAIQLRLLAQKYAPVFRIKTQDSNDRVGMPVLPGAGQQADVDVETPVIFYRLSHTRFDGQWLPQIIYTIWFPSRPAKGMFDILAGHFDGIIWRVTLGADGVPLMHDSIHACGCYHLFFPSSGLFRIKAPEDGDIRETAEMPAGYLTAAQVRYPVVWIDAVSHYVLAITAAGDAGKDRGSVLAALEPERLLTRLPYQDGNGVGSLYSDSGFVPGTDRAEWIVLWPMGIEKPGAMRQWGHHATAFVGRRHFDEPGLFDRYFVPAD
tara:strand:- start:22629 stop:24155 length:1527 start_codon:yes stop_codon:yes gene_type:complete